MLAKPREQRATVFQTSPIARGRARGWPRLRIDAVGGGLRCLSTFGVIKMPHNTRIRPDLAAWSPGSAVLPEEFYALDEAQFRSINGDDGGVWIPNAKIIIGGAGLDIQSTAPFRALGASGYNASMQAQNWPQRSFFASLTTPVNSDVPIAYAPPGTLGQGGSGLIVSVSENAGKLVRSDDGTNWISGSSFAGDLGGPGNDIAYGLLGSDAPGFLISSLNHGGLARSLDGATYTYVGGVAGTRSVLCYAPAPFDTWVAAGDAGVIYTSSDQGATWTARTTPAGWIAGCGGAKRIAWNGSLFVVIPRGAYNKFLTSSNGIVWTERTISHTQTWTGLAWGAYDNTWMAIAESGAVTVSASGTTWATAVSTLATATDLAVINSLWVATMRNGDRGGIAWSTDKGTTWQSTPVGNHRVATGGWQRVIAADNRFTATHADGTNVEFAFSLRSS
jgi:hypothetical protein